VYTRVVRSKASDIPEDDSTTEVMAIPASGAAETGESTGGIEVLVVRDRSSAKKRRGVWRAYEVWTRNRIYGIDASLKCHVVLDRRSGSMDAGNPATGLRLGGGRMKSESTTRVSYPFPLVGMEATFTDGRRQIYTSRVERFVIRIREMQTKMDDLPTWEEIAGET
jgi:hypothetical protein